MRVAPLACRAMVWPLPCRPWLRESRLRGSVRDGRSISGVQTFKG